MNKCQKLRLVKSKLSLEQVLKFSELVALDCPTDKAIKFSTKRYCRYDTTKLMDGPVNHRKLKVNKSSPNLRGHQGWRFDNPIISNRYNLRHMKKMDKMNRQLKTYIDNQTKDIKKRAKTLEKRMKRVNEFYKELNSKYNFTKMERSKLYDRIFKMNEKVKNVKDENSIYKPGINKLTNTLYSNLGRYRKSFRQKEKYQSMMQNIVKHEFQLDFNKKHNKSMLGILRNDQMLIEQLNNSNYKFPIDKNVLRQSVQHRKPSFRTKSFNKRKTVHFNLNR